MNKPSVAYFCMEFGLDKSLPLYAGGLGVLAGDYLKAARDQDAPVVGIGIRWWQDYTNQYINDRGYPYDTFPTHDPESIEKTDCKIYIEIKDEKVECEIYRVDQFDNAPLYLLSTGKPGSKHGWICDKLYAGNHRDRIAQEILLGIGGVRALEALNLDIKKYHFNEGHAAFGGLELIRKKMDSGSAFNQAVDEIRESIIFTTHTPVPAGNESHSLNLLKEMGVSKILESNYLVDIGGDPFNMTAACLRMAGIANGVSEIHGRTARRMWKDLNPCAPIISITNGIHLPTWQDENINQASRGEKDLWSTHMNLKRDLITFIEKKTGTALNPNNILIGFARRAAPYKRSKLIFSDIDRIKKYLTSGQLQLVFSGKAHPHDRYGKRIVAELVKMSQRFPNSIVFLENYDMEIARYLARGCDVWLNNPRRPLEASGTSGMKAAINGVINLSVLDGWVAEGIEHGTSGWILDEVYDEFDFEENLEEDEKDFRALYRIISEEVIPTYYGNKNQWLEMMQESINMARKDFSATRMVKEYFEKMYKLEIDPAVV